jgi:hypothetical protein
MTSAAMMPPPWRAEEEDASGPPAHRPPEPPSAGASATSSSTYSWHELSRCRNGTPICLFRAADKYIAGVKHRERHCYIK